MPNFNAERKYNLNILSGIMKKCTVRFPTDEEWSARHRAIKTTRRPVGRGTTTIDVDNVESANMKLFEKICIAHNDFEFDPADATKLISLLEEHSVLSVDQTPEGFVTTLSVPCLGDTKPQITLKFPTQRDIITYNRSSFQVLDGRRGQEIKVAIKPAEELFDKLCSSHTGFDSPIPIIYKETVVTEVIAAMNSSDSEAAFSPE